MVVGGAALKPQCIVAQVQPNTALPPSVKPLQVLVRGLNCCKKDQQVHCRGGVVSVCVYHERQPCGCCGHHNIALPCRMHQLGVWGVCVKGQQHASVGPHHTRTQAKACLTSRHCMRTNGVGPSQRHRCMQCGGVDTQTTTTASYEEATTASLRKGWVRTAPLPHHVQLQVPVAFLGMGAIERLCQKKVGRVRVAAHSLRGRGI